jgi:hypothetical protein
MLPLLRAARRRTAISHTIALAIVLAALAGCGGSSDNGVASKSASEILAAAKNAALNARSVHIQSQSAQGRLTFTESVDLTTTSGHAQVTFLGLKYEVIRTSEAIYLKGTPAVYENLAIKPARVPAGTWIKAPTTNPQFAQVAAPTKLQGEINLLLPSIGPVTKGASTTTNGQNTIQLKTSGKLYTGSLLVATTGKPYPVQITKTGRETAQVTFSGWNQPIALIPPANTIELSKLQHEGH